VKSILLTVVIAVLALGWLGIFVAFSYAARQEGLMMFVLGTGLVFMLMRGC
jgi:hypothetical protein